MRKFLMYLSVLLLFSTTAFSQSKKINGKVVDESGNPIPKVSVLIRRSRTGTSTDANGMFTIYATKGQYYPFLLLVM